jgi:hypothetical protein
MEIRAETQVDRTGVQRQRNRWETGVMNKTENKERRKVANQYSNGQMCRWDRSSMINMNRVSSQRHYTDMRQKFG